MQSRTSRRPGGTQQPNQELLNAAALQDHFAREIAMPAAVARSSRRPRNSAAAARVEADGGAEALLSRWKGRLSLAQRFGLVERPAEPLTEKQWVAGLQKARERGDTTRGECAICKSGFGVNEPQLLLSCTHVFHRDCLKSFEQFAGKRCCPVCRTLGYQARGIGDGADYQRLSCATRIQAAWRGLRVRRWYAIDRKYVPPQDPLERRLWFEERLAEESDRLAKEQEDAEDEIDALFAEIASRRGEPVEPRRPRTPPPPPPPPPAPPALALDLGVMAEDAAEASVDWDIVIDKVLERGESDCSICFGPLERCGAGNAWLSCSHVFHWECLSAFEQFAEGRGGARCCPICRQDYKRQRM